MKSITVSKGRNFISGTFLVIGTSVGAGMLGLPVETARIGFFPALIVYVICWAAMTLSALILLKVQIRMKGKVNIRSMAYSTLGSTAASIIEALFAALYYSLLVAYLKGFTQILSDSVPNLTFISSAGVALVFFGGCVFFKEKGIKGVNSTLVIGLVITYLLISTIGVKHIDLTALSYTSWKASPFSLPLVVTAFGFHVIIPSLYYHQGEDPKTTRQSILVGTTITLLVYLCWQAIVLGIVPLPALEEAYRMDQTAVIPMAKVLHTSSLPIIGKLFGFFALASSCLGVSIAFYDFIADKLCQNPTNQAKLGLLAAIFLPPLLFMQLKVSIFYSALRYGGGFGVLLLLVLLPVAMYTAQRKQEPIPKRLDNHSLWEKPIIALVLVFCIAGLVINGLSLAS